MIGIRPGWIRKKVRTKVGPVGPEDQSILNKKKERSSGTGGPVDPVGPGKHRSCGTENRSVL